MRSQGFPSSGLRVVLLFARTLKPPEPLGCSPLGAAVGRPGQSWRITSIPQNFETALSLSPPCLGTGRQCQPSARPTAGAAGCCGPAALARMRSSSIGKPVLIFLVVVCIKMLMNITGHIKMFRSITGPWTVLRWVLYWEVFVHWAAFLKLAEPSCFAAMGEQELLAASGLLRSRVHLDFSSCSLPFEFDVHCNVEGAGKHVRSPKSGEFVCLNCPTVIPAPVCALWPAACIAQPGCTTPAHQNQLFSECRRTSTVVVSSN